MKKNIQEFLLQIKHPESDQKFISEKNIKLIDIEDNKVILSIELNFPFKSQINIYENIIQDGLKKIIDSDIIINWSHKILTRKVQQGVNSIKSIKNVIAIASGKGGVGKSSTAANLALALSYEGANVGILDADIYGPSQPQMLGINQKPNSKDGKSMEPLVAHGVQVMSIGFLVDQETPMVWRGPMVTSTLEQLLKETNWDNLDYLIIDLPPGTGDIQLTLAQKIPVTGAIIVTTPQDIALLDARRGLKMFEKVNIPILGIIENMSTHICSNCGHEEYIFGKDGGSKMCLDYKTELLGSLPLDINIREGLDAGKPSIAINPNSDISEIYKKIARKSALKVLDLAEDHSSKFPNIVIQQS
ncbi:iron-sulfur cluster carrier protein ApbC [Methylophilaceae bacterium]|jgi:ATP-binding protein involved in chromosome partitioning|nr:iron-sulfur cluster carrier protein ApbC [Methylophilaceae bacterium]|tara:strand:+ start:1583 stop:2659 length:1077 start_codon:yes stop_codon:yes gene_type:complete